ncbi:MAG: PAS domain-containing protein, partial [Proteobacteria bacterium]|nr:PAS domain-containing protein [Pseudomonadota bacterium]
MEDLSQRLLHSVVNVFLDVCSLWLLIMDNQKVIYANAKARNLLANSKFSLPDDWGHPEQTAIQTLILTDQPNIIIRWRCYYLFPKKGHTVKLYAGEDITVQENYRKKSDLLNDIIAKVPGFVFWKDMDLKLMGCNENFAKQVGYHHPQDIIGLTDHDLPWSESQTEKFIQDDQHILQTGIPKLNIEETQRQLDGQDLTLLTSKVPLYTDGQITGVLGTYVDVTPFKRIEQALRLEKDKAEAVSRLKSNFIMNMEHDIRTPVSGIYGMTQLLADQKIPEDIRSQLVMVTQAAKELLDYCNDIIDFARVDYGMRPVLSYPLDLKALLSAIMRLQTPAAQAKQIGLTLTYDKKTPVIILSDGYRLKRILLNLISNAIKFTQKGYVKVSVHTEKKSNIRHEKVLRFMIQDSGMGIPAGKIDFIYEKFS